MAFSVEVGPSGVEVEVEGIVGRRTKKPSRMIFGATLDGVEVAKDLWFDDLDALAFYGKGIETGDVVKVFGEIYHYPPDNKSSLQHIKVVKVGKVATKDQMVEMCDGTPEFEAGKVSLIDRTGDLIWFADVDARNAALDAIYF